MATSGSPFKVGKAKSKRGQPLAFKNHLISLAPLHQMNCRQGHNTHQRHKEENGQHLVARGGRFSSAASHPLGLFLSPRFSTEAPFTIDTCFLFIGHVFQWEWRRK